MKRLPVHNLDPAAGTDGQVPVIEDGKFVIGSPAMATTFLAHVTTTNAAGDFVDVWTDEGNHLYVEESLT